MKIAKVIVDAPARETDRPFDYLVPRALAPLVTPGVRVAVPFGPRTLHGFVLAVTNETDTDPAKLRDIRSVLDAAPVVTEELMELAQWLSRKYVCPQHTALAALLPGALKTRTETVYELAEGVAEALADGRSAPASGFDSGGADATASVAPRAAGSPRPVGSPTPRISAETPVGNAETLVVSAETLVGIARTPDGRSGASGEQAATAALAEAGDAAEGLLFDWPESETAASAEREALEAGVRELLGFVARRRQVSAQTLLQTFADRPAALRAALERGLLVETSSVKNRVGKKTLLFVVPAAEAEALRGAAASLAKRAPKQAELLRHAAELAETDGSAPLADLMRDLGVGASAVKALEAKGYVAIEERVVSRDPYADRSFEPSRPLPLTPVQAAALAPIAEAIRSRAYVPFLLHGVTGSGKTEVYLQAMQACLDAGREAILLVPEISLTPQTVNAFKSRFGDRVAVMHSRLSQGERYDEWRKIADRQVRIAIGARSAIFAPFTNLGLIIVDEEHESSYKQEESPKYHARDVALERGAKHGAAVVLGSATPSLETYLDAHRGAYRLLEMPERVEGRPLPAVQIVDMRQELREGNRAMFSAPLREALASRLERGEQSVLLLNRRGYSTFVMCRSCGYAAQCPHCDITLTYHRTSRHSRCHYCGYTEREAARCPSCDSEHIRHFGAGTQRVEEELAKLFPGVRTIRMDVDTTSEKGAHEKLLAAFRERKADVLLGTQMVAKGLDFPYVTLVGVVSADTVLRLPDFRAAEKTFQLLTQVAGRAGRHLLPGEVIVQTYTPEHYSIQYASKHDYRGYARRELLSRRELGYPPYSRLALATLSHEDISYLVQASEKFAVELKRRFAALRREGVETELLGPVPSPIPKLKDRYRFQCMVKYRGEIGVAEALRASADALRDDIRKSKLSIQLDVDPQVLS